jgi:hypothetical protein
VCSVLAAGAGEDCQEHANKVGARRRAQPGRAAEATVDEHKQAVDEPWRAKAVKLDMERS